MTMSSREPDADPATLRWWRVEGEALVRERIFRDFDEALGFLERVAQMADDYGRRPDMCISEFNHVRLSISNLHRAGFTQAEMRLAAKVNGVLQEHHPEAWAEEG
jgi:4a-hydroxytetrahydrobiopterin dehydratase